MKYNSLIIKVGEITLKGKNRGKFERLLLRNVKKVLRSENYKIKKYPGRIVIFSDNIDRIINKIRKVFGIVSIIPTIHFEFKSLEEISNKVEKIFKDVVIGNKFRIDCRRVGNHEFSSSEVKKVVGSSLSKYGKVDLKNPNIIIYIEIRDNDVYVSKDFIKCYGGLPIGSEGKVLCTLSGGFDSTIASLLVMRRGALPYFFTVYFDDYHLRHLARIFEIISDYLCGVKSSIFLVNGLDLYEKIIKNVRDERYWVIIFKRFMFKLCEKIMERKKFLYLVTGDSLGQKSSQTLENMLAEEFGLNIRIIRPLFGFDKVEVFKLAREFELYETLSKSFEYSSILSINPKTKASISKVLELFTPLEKYVDVIKVKKFRVDDFIKNFKDFKEEINISLKDIKDMKFYIHRDISLETLPKNFERFKNIMDLLKKVDKNKERDFVVISKTLFLGKLVEKLVKERDVNCIYLDEERFKRLLSS